MEGLAVTRAIAEVRSFTFGNYCRVEACGADITNLLGPMGDALVLPTGLAFVKRGTFGLGATASSSDPRFGDMGICTAAPPALDTGIFTGAKSKRDVSATLGIPSKDVSKCSGSI